MGGDFALARQKMVEGQLVPGNVQHEAVAAALGQVSREVFVPAHFQANAYADEPVPMGGGRFLLSPLVFARLLATADVQPGDKVLDLACATGYSTAVLSRLAHEVVGVEDDSQMVAYAKQRMHEDGITNAKIIEASPAAGYEMGGKYAVIFIGGAVEAIADTLIRQLEKNGKIVAVQHVKTSIGMEIGIGKVVLYRKINGALETQVLWDVAAPLLPAFTKRNGFVF